MRCSHHASIFEKEGMRVIGWTMQRVRCSRPLDRWASLSLRTMRKTDILHGAKVTEALGALDIGQAAVVCEGLVLAVEAAEGTDAMLTRVASLSEALRGTPTNRKGVLVKTARAIRSAASISRSSA
jgi:DUF1009 family protein